MDFGDFLKNHEPDLLSGGCWEEGGGRVEEERVWGCCVVEREEDCGEGVSFRGRIRWEKGISRTWRESISGWGGICNLEGSKEGSGGLSVAVGDMAGGRRGIVGVDNIEGRER